MNKKISISKALTWIIGSMLFVTGGGYSSIKTYLKYRQQVQSDPKYYLSRILQTGPQREALNTTYLAELMQVAADRPTNLKLFDPKRATLRLLQSPVIKKATVKIVKPDTVYIDYTVRQPVALLYDFSNTAVDEQGYPFPITPFFSPKKLTEIYLGVNKIAWNQPVQGKEIQLALSILKLLSELYNTNNLKNRLSFVIKRIDVSKAFEENLGRREIVVIVEPVSKLHLDQNRHFDTSNSDSKESFATDSVDHRGFFHYLRLSLKNYPQEMGNYLELCSQLPPQTQVIDLRIPQLGFIDRLETLNFDGKILSPGSCVYNASFGSPLYSCIQEVKRCKEPQSHRD